MKTTLIVENNLQLQSFYAINLHTWVGTHCISKSEAKLAMQYLMENAGHIDLIITKASIGTERSAEAIFKYLLDKALSIPLLVIGDGPLASNGVTHIFSALAIKDIIQHSAKALKVTAKEMAALSVPEFFEIPIQNFFLLKESICDIYTMEGNTYTPYLNATQEIHKNNLKKMSEAGTRFLFVRKNDRLKFVTNMNEEIAAQLNLNELNTDEQISAVEMSQNLLHTRIKRLGITDETIDLAKRNLKFMAKTANKSPKLKHLLARLIKNKTGYQFQHSQLLMFVATHLMNQMDWVTDEQRKKLQFMAFFHDITLENSEMARIHTSEALRASSFTDKEKEEIKKHAQASAVLATQYPGAPAGVDQIIKQHHGMLNGVGFSEHYSQNISPMAIVFILSEDFVDELIQTGKDFSVAIKISQMRERYTTQRFKKIIDALEKIAL